MFLEAVRASEVSTGSRYSPISGPEITTQEGSGGGSVYVGVKKVNFFEKKLCSEMIPNGFPHHPHHFFCRNSTNFTPIGAHFVACMMEFSCFGYTMLRKRRFSQEKILPKRHPKACKRLPTSSNCSNALFLIMFSR